MTICIATSNFPPQTGGIATFSHHLAELLNRQGHRVIVLTPGETDNTANEDHLTEVDGYSVIHLRKKFSAYRAEYEKYFSAGSLDAPYWIAAGLAMQDWLLENHQRYAIDIIEAGDYGGTGIFLCHPSLPPVVITAHGSFIQLKNYNDVNEDAHTVAVARLELLSLQQADGIIAHSQQNQAAVEKIAANKTFLAHAPWKLTGTAAAQPEEGYCITAGGLQKVKGAVTMLETVSILHSSGNKIAVFWAGGDSYTAPLGGKMSDYLAIKFPGVWNQSFNWLQELAPADIQEKISRSCMVIIPSLWEAFNYVALEAAAAARPIIMTTATGAADLFTHGHDAWIIPPGDPVKLVEAIVHVQEDVSLRKTLGTNAQETIRNIYTGEKVVDERIAIYRKIIADRKKRTSFTVSTETVIAPYKNTSRKIFFRLKKWIKKILGR